jgi:hypothetical protein
MTNASDTDAHAGSFERNEPSSMAGEGPGSPGADRSPGPEQAGSARGDADADAEADDSGGSHQDEHDDDVSVDPHPDDDDDFEGDDGGRQTVETVIEKR